MSGRTSPTPADRIGDALFSGLIGAARRLPYERRVPLVGRAFAALGPLAGYRARAERHLALALPDLALPERRRIARAVLDNAGRTLAELYSASEFRARVAAADPLAGPGLPALLAAQAEGRPAVLVAAHYGNFDVIRAALVARGIRIGALYRPMNNPLFEAHWRAALEAVATPVFPRGRAGLGGLLRLLREGGTIILAGDQHVGSGVPIPFFGRPAMTTLSPAEMALRHDALLIPAHGIRQPDGLSFEARLDPPVAQGTPVDMMTEVTARFEAVIRADPGQWFWVHRRWK